MTRSVADRYPEWTKANLDARQYSLAKLAASIWRVSQLHE